jgi:hypothetical protein
LGFSRPAPLARHRSYVFDGKPPEMKGGELAKRCAAGGAPARAAAHARSSTAAWAHAQLSARALARPLRGLLAATSVTARGARHATPRCVRAHARIRRAR